MKALLSDSFGDDSSLLLDAGWVFASVYRYEPTIVKGVTPTGRAFNLTITANGAATLTIAGRTRTAQLPDGWQDGAETVNQWLTLYSAFPANQR